jgi:hypothetical protein
MMSWLTVGAIRKRIIRSSGKLGLKRPQERLSPLNSGVNGSTVDRI